MGMQDKLGSMAQRLRALNITNEGGLRLILNTLLEPSTQMVDAGWAEDESWHRNNGRAAPPPIAFRAMVRSALSELIDDEAQHADTDGLAIQHARLHDYLHRAGIEKEAW